MTRIHLSNLQTVALKKPAFEEFTRTRKSVSTTALLEIVNDLYHDIRENNIHIDESSGEYAVLFDAYTAKTTGGIPKEIQYVTMDLEYWKNKLERGEKIHSSQVEKILWYHMFKTVSYPFGKLWYMNPYIRFSDHLYATLKQNPFFSKNDFIYDTIAYLGMFKREVQLFGGKAATFDMIAREVDEAYASKFIEAQGSATYDLFGPEYKLWIDLLGKVITNQIFLVVINRL